MATPVPPGKGLPINRPQPTPLLREWARYPPGYDSSKGHDPKLPLLTFSGG